MIVLVLHLAANLTFNLLLYMLTLFTLHLFLLGISVKLAPSLFSTRSVSLPTFLAPAFIINPLTLRHIYCIRRPHIPRTPSILFPFSMFTTSAVSTLIFFNKCFAMSSFFMNRHYPAAIVDLAMNRF